MFSFKLAGAGKKRDWVPRPLTCITFAAPFSGGSSYRAAFEVRASNTIYNRIKLLHDTHDCSRLLNSITAVLVANSNFAHPNTILARGTGWIDPFSPHQQWRRYYSCESPFFSGCKKTFDEAYGYQLPIV